MPTIVAMPNRAGAATLSARSAAGGAVPISRPMTGSVVAITAPLVPPPPFKGFGYVQYLPALGTAGVLLQAGQRVALSMPADPSQTLDSLAGPFAGWSFWDGADLRARAVGDAYDVRLTLSAMSSVAGGDVFCDATVNGAATAIETDQSNLVATPGTVQILSFRLALYPKAGFVAGGARVYLTPTVPVTIVNEKLIIAPTTAGPSS